MYSGPIHIRTKGGRQGDPRLPLLVNRARAMLSSMDGTATLGEELGVRKNTYTAEDGSYVVATWTPYVKMADVVLVGGEEDESKDLEAEEIVHPLMFTGAVRYAEGEQWGSVSNSPWLHNRPTYKKMPGGTEPAYEVSWESAVSGKYADTPCGNITWFPAPKNEGDTNPEFIMSWIGNQSRGFVTTKGPQFTPTVSRYFWVSMFDEDTPLIKIDAERPVYGAFVYTNEQGEERYAILNVDSVFSIQVIRRYNRVRDPLTGAWVWELAWSAFPDQRTIGIKTTFFINPDATEATALFVATPAEDSKIKPKDGEVIYTHLEITVDLSGGTVTTTYDDEDNFPYKDCTMRDSIDDSFGCLQYKRYTSTVGEDLDGVNFYGEDPVFPWQEGTPTVSTNPYVADQQFINQLNNNEQDPYSNSMPTVQLSSTSGDPWGSVRSFLENARNSATSNFVNSPPTLDLAFYYSSLGEVSNDEDRYREAPRAGEKFALSWTYQAIGSSGEPLTKNRVKYLTIGGVELLDPLPPSAQTETDQQVIDAMPLELREHLIDPTQNNSPCFRGSNWTRGFKLSTSLSDGDGDLVADAFGSNVAEADLYDWATNSAIKKYVVVQDSVSGEQRLAQFYFPSQPNLAPGTDPENATLDDIVSATCSVRWVTQGEPVGNIGVKLTQGSLFKLEAQGMKDPWYRIDRNIEKTTGGKQIAAVDYDKQGNKVRLFFNSAERETHFYRSATGRGISPIDDTFELALPLWPEGVFPVGVVPPESNRLQGEARFPPVPEPSQTAGLVCTEHVHTKIEDRSYFSIEGGEHNGKVIQVQNFAVLQKWGVVSQGMPGFDEFPTDSDDFYWGWYPRPWDNAELKASTVVYNPDFPESRPSMDGVQENTRHVLQNPTVLYVDLRAGFVVLGGAAVVGTREEYKYYVDTGGASYRETENVPIANLKSRDFFNFIAMNRYGHCTRSSIDSIPSTDTSAFAVNSQIAHAGRAPVDTGENPDYVPTFGSVPIKNKSHLFRVGQTVNYTTPYSSVISIATNATMSCVEGSPVNAPVTGRRYAPVPVLSSGQPSEDSSKYCAGASDYQGSVYANIVSTWYEKYKLGPSNTLIVGDDGHLVYAWDVYNGEPVEETWYQRWSGALGDIDDESAHGEVLPSEEVGVPRWSKKISYPTEIWYGAKPRIKRR